VVGLQNVWALGVRLWQAALKDTRSRVE